jgi:hypothetical protein
MEKVNWFIAGFSAGVTVCSLYSVVKTRKLKVQLKNKST